MSWPKAQGNKFQMKPVDNINYKISLPMCLGQRTGLWKLGRIGDSRLVSQTANKFRTKFDKDRKFGQFFHLPWLPHRWANGKLIRLGLVAFDKLNSPRVSELLHCTVTAKVLGKMI